MNVVWHFILFSLTKIKFEKAVKFKFYFILTWRKYLFQKKNKNAANSFILKFIKFFIARSVFFYNGRSPIKSIDSQVCSVPNIIENLFIKKSQKKKNISPVWSFCFVYCEVYLLVTLFRYLICWSSVCHVRRQSYRVTQDTFST